MKNPLRPKTVFFSICLTVLMGFAMPTQAAAPDLTAAGVIAALKTDSNASPLYGETYNLGAIGLRGWIYVGGGNGADGKDPMCAGFFGLQPNRTVEAEYFTRMSKFLAVKAYS